MTLTPPLLAKMRAGDLLVALPGHSAQVPDGKLLVAKDETGLYVAGFHGKVYIAADKDGLVMGFARPPLENA